jgi:hypothetical protein
MKKRPGAMVTDGSTWLTEKTRVVATASPAPAANCTVYARLAFKASSVMLAVAETLFAAVEVKSITNEQLAPAPKLAGGDAALNCGPLLAASREKALEIVSRIRMRLSAVYNARYTFKVFAAVRVQS